MEFHFLLVLFLTSFRLAITSAILPQEVYWQSVLPATPMPNAIRELLPSELKSDTKDQRIRRAVSMSFKDSAMTIGIGGSSIDVGKGASLEVPPVSGLNAVVYWHHASEDEVRGNENATIFFLVEDLHPGTKMNLNFKRTSAKRTFLPRQVADMIPFSSKNISEILHTFSVKPNSTKSEMMEKTIEECEEPVIEGEDKYCATSLEAMVDFITSKLGKDIQVLVTDTYNDDTKQQEFRINRGVRMAGSNIVACHPQNYVYPVYLCHNMHTAKAYMVPLVGIDKTKVNATAVCHFDTSKWNPKHLAFQVLKVKPGTVSICHFLPADHIVWVTD